MDLLINERVKIVRKSLGLTQSELAGSIGVSAGAISQIEGGESGVSVDTLYNISTVHNISLDWIIAGRGTMKLGQLVKSAKYVEDRISELEQRVLLLEASGDTAEKPGATGYDAPVPKNPLTKKVDTPLVGTTRKKV